MSLLIVEQNAESCRSHSPDRAYVLETGTIVAQKEPRDRIACR